MSLQIYKRKSGKFHVRGIHYGVRIDQSARTDKRDEALAVAEKWEREIFQEVIHGKKPERTFAEAAYGYLKGGGEKRYMNTIARAEIKLNGSRFAFATMPLSAVTQDVIDALAEQLYPDGARNDAGRSVRLRAGVGTDKGVGMTHVSRSNDYRSE